MIAQFSLELHSFRSDKFVEQFFERQIAALFDLMRERDDAWISFDEVFHSADENDRRALRKVPMSIDDREEVKHWRFRARDEETITNPSINSRRHSTFSENIFERMFLFSSTRLNQLWWSIKPVDTTNSIRDFFCRSTCSRCEDWRENSFSSTGNWATNWKKLWSPCQRNGRNIVLVLVAKWLSAADRVLF